jgi:hypothetical protein
MKHLQLLGAAVCAAASFGLAQSADATVWTTTYKGVVTAGSDNAGTFGLGCTFCGGGELSGLAFTAVFVTDDSTPGATVTTSATSLNASGSGPANPTHGSLTINGHTLFLGDDSGSQELFDDGVDQTVGHSANNHSNNVTCSVDPEVPGCFGAISSDQLSLSASGVGDGDFGTLPAGMVGFGTLSQFREFDAGFVGFSFDSRADLLVSSVAMTSDAVPEPAIWGLMILGFGATGAALRRRRGPSTVRA